MALSFSTTCHSVFSFTGDRLFYFGAFKFEEELEMSLGGKIMPVWNKLISPLKYPSLLDRGMAIIFSALIAISHVWCGPAVY